MGLKISMNKYISLVEMVGKKIIEEEINDVESEFEPGVAIPVERVDKLQKLITKRITKNLMNLIVKKDLFQPEYVWRRSSFDSGLYVRKRKDPDQMDIPTQYLNVRKLLPNLRDMIEEEIHKILNKKREWNKC